MGLLPELTSQEDLMHIALIRVTGGEPMAFQRHSGKGHSSPKPPPRCMPNVVCMPFKPASSCYYRSNTETQRW